MLKRLLPALCFFIPVLATAQLPTYNWAIGCQNGVVDDRGNAIATDAAGNAFVVGAFVGSIDVDPGAGVTTLTAGGQYQNAFVAKYDANKNLVWANVIQSDVQSEIEDIALDPAGNITVVGHFMGTIDFDPGIGAQLATAANGTDLFVGKYDPNGNYVWAFPLTGTGYRSLTAVACDAAGNVVITGWSNGSVDYDPGPGVQTVNVLNAQQHNVIVAKYSPSGNYLFAFNLRSVNANARGEAMNLTVTKAGSIAVCGYFMDSTDFDPGPGVQMQPGHTNNMDVFVVQFDTLGNYQWVVTFGSAGSFQTGNDHGFDVCSDPFNNIIVTGIMRGTVDFDPSPATYTLFSSGAEDAFLAKYSSTGALVWVNKLGATGNDAGLSVCTDSTGAIYTSGTFVNTVDFDPGAATYTLVSPGVGYSDAYVASYKASGTFRFAFQVGNNVYLNIVNGISVQSTSIYIAGTFSNVVDFDPSPATATLSSAAGNMDFFVARYDEAPTGLDDQTDASQALNIYADAATQQIGIFLPGNSGKAKIEIYNASGALVLSDETDEQSTLLYASQLATGLYHCRVTTADGSALTRSFVFTQQ